VSAVADDLLDLGGRVALVTGAGQGVGRAVALAFARHGARRVLVNDFYPERAETVAREVADLGCEGVATPFDVTDIDAVRAAFADAGQVDILVNNAGNAGSGAVTIDPPFWESDPADWDRWLKPNLHGALNVTHAVLPGMVERGYGRVVTVISDAGRVGEPHLVIYSAAKAGAAGFMRALAKAVGRHGITANCVALSSIRTPTIEPLLDEEAVTKMLRHYPIKRIGEPEDAAAMILFLSSDAASWITGQTYPVNGGYSFAV
jgi:2-hydroxycyclohexanecarboxyl-CoA dehydrogenase